MERLTKIVIVGMEGTGVIRVLVIQKEPRGEA